MKKLLLLMIVLGSMSAFAEDDGKKTPQQPAGAIGEMVWCEECQKFIQDPGAKKVEGAEGVKTKGGKQGAKVVQ